MRKTGTLYRHVTPLLLIFLLIFVLPSRAANVEQRRKDGQVKELSEEEKQMVRLLDRTAAYCKKLRNASIYYYCKEKVKEIIYPLPKRFRGHVNDAVGIHAQYHKFYKKSSLESEFLYDYQLLRKRRNKEKERRFLLRENGIAVKKKRTRLKTRNFIYTTIVLSPLVFEEEEQRFYNFKLAGRESWGDMSVLAIEVSPRQGIQKKMLWGKFWLDVKDYSIIKIEMSQESIGGYYKIIKTAAVMNAEPRIKTVMEFDIEKNGIRFPGKFSLEEAYVTPGDEKIVLSELHVQYYDYMFFNVGMDVQYDNPAGDED